MKPVVGVLRQRRIGLIIYLDGPLIMAESYNQALLHAASTLNLQEGLSFMVNYRKLHSELLQPCQELQFLGVFDKFQCPITSTFGGKVAKDPQEMPTVVRTNNNFGSTIVQIPGNISGFPPLQEFLDVFDKFQHRITSTFGGKVAKGPQEMPTVVGTNNNFGSTIVQIPGDISGFPPLQASSEYKNW